MTRFVCDHMLIGIADDSVTMLLIGLAVGIAAGAIGSFIAFRDRS